MRRATLDPVHDGRHRIASLPGASESLAFVLPLPAEGLGVIVYTWVDRDSRAGALVTVFGPGIGDEPVYEIVRDQEVAPGMGFDDWCVGPLRVQHDEPLWSAHVVVAGERVSLDYRFEGMNPAYDYGGHADGCPWYLAADRYEQSGTATGVLTVGGRCIPFRTTTHRDHSWGTRNWGAPTHWKWVVAQAGPDLGVHLMAADVLGRTDLRGYVHKDGVTAEVLALEDQDFVLGPDLMHRSFAVELQDDAGRRTTLALEARAGLAFAVDPALALHAVAMAGTIDGRRAVGHVEMAWAREYLESAKRDAGTVSHLRAAQARLD